MEPLCVQFTNRVLHFQAVFKGMKSFLKSSRSYTISHRVIENTTSNQPPLLMAHGLLGNKNNFNSISKKLNQQTGRMIITYDARNHGVSGHFDTMTLEDMCEDATQLLDLLNIEKCVFVGHSMGGRVAIYTALKKPQRIDKLVVVDSSPSLSTSVRVAGSTLGYVRAMEKVDWSNAITLSNARREAEHQLAENIMDNAVRNFVLTNIKETKPGKFGWRVNLRAIREHIESPRQVYFNKHNMNPFSGDTLFLGGSLSDFITSADFPVIKDLFPNSIISHVPCAGHWVHSDNPEDFVSSVVNFLNPTKKPLFQQSSA